VKVLEGSPQILRQIAMKMVAEPRNCGMIVVGLSGGVDSAVYYQTIGSTLVLLRKASFFVLDQPRNDLEKVEFRSIFLSKEHRSESDLREIKRKVASWEILVSLMTDEGGKMVSTRNYIS
jgi:NH3-dependent NAD+ synthetase